VAQVDYIFLQNDFHLNFSNVTGGAAGGGFVFCCRRLQPLEAPRGILDRHKAIAVCQLTSIGPFPAVNLQAGASEGEISGGRSR
jgi:hypothetical protein